MRRGQSQPSPITLSSLVEFRASSLSSQSDMMIVSIDAAGRSSTYALRFVNSDAEDYWVAVAGGSGQPIFGLTSQQVDELLDAMVTRSAP